MKISYKAVSKDGKTYKGILEAKGVDEAVVLLRSRQLLPTHVVPQQQSTLLKYLPFLGKVKSSDMVFLTRQLSSMLASGLTLMQSLSILREQIQKPAVNDIILAIISDIEDGKSCSQALEKHPEVFSPMYISLIKASETSGLLDKVLLRLADNLESAQKLRGTIKSALMYPIIVIIGMIVVVVIMMIFVIPTLSTLYESLNIPLPLPTQIVVGISRFLINFWFLLIGLLAVLFFFFKRWHATEAGKIIMDEFVLKLPIFGKLIREMVLTEFSRTLGLLISSGTLVVDATTQTADTAANIVYKNAVKNVANRVEKDMSMGDAIASYAIFPPILVQMVQIGEETGKLDESLIKVSEYFEREVNQTVKTLTTAMEPFIMVVLGIGVAFLIISIITPIYSLTSAIK